MSVVNSQTNSFINPEHANSENRHYLVNTKNGSIVSVPQDNQYDDANFMPLEEYQRIMQETETLLINSSGTPHATTGGDGFNVRHSKNFIPHNTNGKFLSHPPSNSPNVKKKKKKM